MNRDDIEKLMGGYAAGTLTADERQALFEAALEDQQLFENLAAEEPLRELLQDPAAKAQLLVALDDRPAPWYGRLVWPAFGVTAATAMVLLAVFGRHEPPKPEPVVVAETRREPVRSFQAPLPVEKSPLPTALPPAPKMPVRAAPPPALDAIAQAAPLAPAAPPPSAGVTLSEPLGAAAADSESAKANLQVQPSAAAPAFRARQFVASAGDAAAAARLGLSYTIYKKSPTGELTEVDPQTELDRTDEVVFRFDAKEPGFLSVSRLDGPNGLQSIINSRVLPSAPLTVPIIGGVRANATGANEFLVRFSREAPSALKPAPAVAGQAGGTAVRSANPEPGAATFNITLKYK
jgi:hypothetical protein